MLSYKNHTITTDGDKIIIDGEAVKVIENPEYTYKINKTCISAQGGAQGLYNFMEDLIREDFARCWTEAVIDGAARISARRAAR